MTKTLLHVEGFSVLALSLYFYGYNQFSWLLFALFLLAPDLSIVGYMINNKMGAIIYNIVHTYTISIVIVLLSLLMANETLLTIGLIWTAHIGMDRMCGFGLKYRTQFKDTHFDRL